MNRDQLRLQIAQLRDAIAAEHAQEGATRARYIKQPDGSIVEYLERRITTWQTISARVIRDRDPEHVKLQAQLDALSPIDPRD